VLACSLARLRPHTRVFYDNPNVLAWRHFVEKHKLSEKAQRDFAAMVEHGFDASKVAKSPMTNRIIEEELLPTSPLYLRKISGMLLLLLLLLLFFLFNLS
jgi:hypothetical protein